MQALCHVIHFSDSVSTYMYTLHEARSSSVVFTVEKVNGKKTNAVLLAKLLKSQKAPKAVVF